MGLPSIVTDINGCNEIVKEEYNGLIIPTKDTGELEEALSRFLENKEFIEKMAKVSRSSICENYERTYVWKELLKEYETLLNKN